ncbi:LysR family transcriptional regulator [Cupriavidus metallidurans]|uniref:LysR family transcriptional regulator n=1 Tax=Cupriavidus TaxID=106589 RepID=UPI00257F5BF7|nr:MULTISPECIES: LysR family transcriptional regulator [unclassified Cupriavidus]GMG92996.1 LysR family transcriptional regulator [Cupriavidus sp. TKC]
MATFRFSLRQLELFSIVARTGSTSAAGEEAVLSQSAVSAAVNELEQTLGVTLFDRVSKRLVLNDAGRALQERATRLIWDARAIERDFSGGHPPCHLRVAASTTIGNYLIPRILAYYHASYPECRVDTQIGNSHEVIRLVSEARADVGIIEGPSPAADLVSHKWSDDELIIVASPHDRLAVTQTESGQPVSREQLQEANWLFREEGSGTRDAVMSALFSYLGPLTPQTVLGSSEAIKYAVELGLGISCLSRILVQGMLDKGAIIELRTDFPRLIRPLSIVSHPARPPSVAMSEFLNLFRTG